MKKRKNYTHYRFIFEKPFIYSTLQRGVEVFIRVKEICLQATTSENYYCVYMYSENNEHKASEVTYLTVSKGELNDFLETCGLV